MPQFDVSNFSSQIFWLIVCFLFYIFVSNIIKNPGIIDCRIGAIDKTLQK